MDLSGLDWISAAAQLVKVVGYGYQTLNLVDTGTMTAAEVRTGLVYEGVDVAQAMVAVGDGVCIAVTRQHYYRALKLLGRWGVRSG